MCSTWVYLLLPSWYFFLLCTMRRKVFFSIFILFFCKDGFLRVMMMGFDIFWTSVSWYLRLENWWNIGTVVTWWNTIVEIKIHRCSGAWKTMSMLLKLNNFNVPFCINWCGINQLILEFETWVGNLNRNLVYSRTSYLMDYCSKI